MKENGHTAPRTGKRFGVIQEGNRFLVVDFGSPKSHPDADAVSFPVIRRLESEAAAKKVAAGREIEARS